VLRSLIGKQAKKTTDPHTSLSIFWGDDGRASRRDTLRSWPGSGHFESAALYVRRDLERDEENGHHIDRRGAYRDELLNQKKGSARHTRGEDPTQSARVKEGGNCLNHFCQGGMEGALGATETKKGRSEVVLGNDLG